MSSPATNSGKKVPGNPRECVLNHCEDCESFEDCRRALGGVIPVDTATQTEVILNSLGSLRWEQGDINAPKSN